MCRGYYGSFANKFNAKIVCSDFDTNYVGGGTPSTIKLAFKIKNPTVAVAPVTFTMGTALSIPLIIYSESLTTRRKTNYNYIDNAIYVYNSNHNIFFCIKIIF